MGNVIIGTPLEDSHNTIRARIERNGALIEQADVSAITYKSFSASGGAVVTQTSLTVADVIFETVQTSTLDPAGRNSSKGYNFKFDVPGAAWPTGAEKSTVEVKITMDDGAIGHIVARGEVTPIYGS